MGKYKNVIYGVLTWLHREQVEGDGFLKYNPKLTHFVFGARAHIQMKGDLRIGENSYGNNGRSNIIRMDEDSLITVNGNFKFMYGADVILFSGAKLSLGNNSFINSDCKLRCHKNISIGDDCKISHDFTVMDSDAHCLEGDNHTKPIFIGNKVWIGTRVTILSGTVLGEGCVVAAGAVVRGEFPPHSLIGGIPAKVIRSNVVWSD